MDDSGWSWPAWKFGMKRDELFTKLHDQYNTVAFSIQDPEAFHHDVYEISNNASTVDELHRQLADRKQLRLNELNQSLESASLEIIANPNLIGTQQWQHAVQLFRTKSLDSLVRYFASYLPDDHPWHKSTEDPTSIPFFDDSEDGVSFMTDEPLSINTSISSIPASHLPPSPRSLTMCSDDSAASTPARTLSFSEHESDVMVLSTTLSRGFDDEDMSQPEDPDTPTTSISDMSEIRSLEDVEEVENEEDEEERQEEEKYQDEDGQTPLGSVVQENETIVSDTPTPRGDEFSSDPELYSDITKMVSSRYTSPHKGIRAKSPGLSRSRRRSPEIGRVQKPSPDPTRIRPKGRRRQLGG
ncbi:uncharacterized protein GGS25DRAFT_452725 [Hypoxylon fragiforme]|uniref:uncharacterized protein n=1 Tax=Hypoxylon fragiforme TaxID=63214 RepID=UPI0020C5EF3E|nr:uncharacterized protein GGS25DRAFT_452725 [Hypoxylon fragiforme]KAI2604231.1 hypothetical protein GGS25DRAFT_452725 [Hypoxylon fragiforme]